MSGHVSGVVYTMHHEVVPRPCEIYDWLLDSSRDHFGLHQGKIVIMAMELEVIKIRILRPTLSLTWFNEFCGWRGKRGALVEKTRAHGREMFLQ